MRTHHHATALALVLMTACVGYTVIVIANRGAADALALGFIGFVTVATIVLRILRYL